MEKKASAPAEVLDSASNIHFGLGKLNITLSSSSPLVDLFAHQFLHDWISPDPSPETAASPDFHLQFKLVDTLPPLPQQQPVFVGQDHHLPDGVGTLFVYAQPDGYLLYFQNAAVVHLKRDASHQIQGHITTRLLQYGRLHDLLFTSLSPALRQRGYYLIHASAAVYEGQAVLFAGAPGCGKTTTVLNLALNKWGVLSNDTLLLERRPEGIYALPTPGGFVIRSKSVTHLPALTPYLPPNLHQEFYYLSLQKFGLQYHRPARVSTIYFPQIDQGRDNELRPLSSAVALAQLIEHSLDRWDSTNIRAHISFLEQLSRQSQAAVLQIAHQETVLLLLQGDIEDRRQRT